MMAPRIPDYWSLVLLLGVIVLGAIWATAPAFIVAGLFLLLGATTYIARIMGVITLIIWIGGHASVWLWEEFVASKARNRAKKQHDEFMRIRNMFYHPNAVCGETLEGLVERERKWIYEGEPGRNVPESPLRNLSGPQA